MKQAYLLNFDQASTAYPDGLVKVGNAFNALRFISRTGTEQTGPIMHNYTSAHIVIGVNSVSGSISVQPIIRGIVPAATPGIFETYTYDVLVGNAFTTTGTKVYKIGPGFPGLAGLVANDVLPPVFDVRLEHSTADAIEYEVSIMLMG